MFAILKLQKKGFQNAVKIKKTADSVKEHFKHSEQLDDDIRINITYLKQYWLHLIKNKNTRQIKLYRW